MAALDELTTPQIIYGEGAAPATPAAGTVVTYAKADGLIYSKDDAGVETLVSGGTGGGGSALTVDDEGTPLATAATTLDFVGAGVTASGTGATKTITIPGGGGAGADTGGTYFRYPLDRGTLHGTYGDEFDGASLNARWTRATQTSGEETYQQGPRASSLRVAYSTGAASRYIYQTAPNGTNETWEASLSVWQPTTTGQMFALVMLDTSGNGVGAFLYDSTAGLYLGNIAAHAYSSILASTAYGVDEHRWGRRYWLRLRKATGLYAASYSFDGENYSPEASGTPTAFTPARVGVGRILGTTAGDTADWHWFDKTA
jgi:hypothetical protein